MFKKIILPISAATVIALSSCSSKLGPLTADNFDANPNPLETEGGFVPVTINGNFPEKYMKKKAVITVTPELRAANGTVLRGAPVTFQGEKVQGNEQTISYILGGHYVMKASFPYSDTYHQSDLYMTFDAMVGKKMQQIPAVKIANGVVATSELYRSCLTQSGGCIAPDSFQRIRKERQEANVKFLINQAQLRKSELANNSVTEFVKLLKAINNDKERYTLDNVEVKSYASPDGGQEFNDKLAAQRRAVSEQYVKDVMKKGNISGDVAAEYTAQDWEGFQQLVAASNIQDKDVILRVLSMYKDPEEREEQIKNMSAGFRELAEGILPELRRSRLIINYEAVGRSDAEIMTQYKSNPEALRNDEILYAATLDDVSDSEKVAIYKTAAKLFPNDYRALNNLAAMAVKDGDLAAAQRYIDEALRVNPRAAEPNANLALIALNSGKIKAAEDYLAQAVGGNDFEYAQGVLNIAKGNYAAAAANLREQSNNMSALASILNKDYESARVIFKQIDKAGDSTTDYLHAIMCARQKNSYAANTYLKDAIAKNPAWKKYAAQDIEFRNVK